jgi:signal transduction histidine kinase
MEDENFPRLGVGIACGLRSAVAFPVLSGESVMAVLEFFDTQVREPGEGALHMLAQAGTQLGRVIERQQAQQALQARAADLAKARDQAEAADRAKSAFLAAMSHELRTPLNAIIGYSEMMQYEIVGPLGARYKEYAGDIQRSGVHLKNIINDILDLSKVSVGELSLRETSVSLDGLAQACVRIINPMAAKGEVGLRCSLPEDLPVLQADETRLQQAILNILSNAIKFTPPGGSVTFTARREACGDLKMEICDTGIGMTEAEVTVALQPFRQIDSSLSRRYEGTGLGLPLAKAFIDLHNGKLAVHSAPGAGTRVEILLPASRCLAA